MMMIDLLYTAFEQSLLSLPLTLGLYLTYRLLKITELTVEGTYVFGAACYSAVLVQSNSFFYAYTLTLLGALTIASIVSIIHRFYSGQELMVGILGGFMMYSVNLIIMSRPHISLISEPTILDFLGEEHRLLILFLSILIISCAFYVILKSPVGLILRGLGLNNQLMSNLNYPVFRYRTAGLMLTHVLAAISGCFTAQSYGFADIHMGSGVALTSLGSMIVGLNLSIKILRRYDLSYDLGVELLGCLAGSLFYFLLMGGLLHLGLSASSLKLAIGIVLLFTLSKGSDS